METHRTQEYVDRLRLARESKMSRERERARVAAELNSLHEILSIALNGIKPVVEFGPGRAFAIRDPGHHVSLALSYNTRVVCEMLPAPDAGLWFGIETQGLLRWRKVGQWRAGDLHAAVAYFMAAAADYELPPGTVNPDRILFVPGGP